MIEVQSGSYLGRMTSCVWGCVWALIRFQTPPGVHGWHSRRFGIP